MKTLKLFLTALTLFTVFATAKANTPNKPVILSKDYAVTTYIDAMCHGKINGFNDVLDQNVKFSMVRGKQVISTDKTAMLDFLKANQNIDQDCTISTSVVDSNSAVTVVKVDMKYENFTRSNYVTIANTTDGWKITNVHSVFKS